MHATGRRRSRTTYTFGKTPLSFTEDEKKAPLLFSGAKRKREESDHGSRKRDHRFRSWKSGSPSQARPSCGLKSAGMPFAEIACATYPGPSGGALEHLAVRYGSLCFLELAALSNLPIWDDCKACSPRPRCTVACIASRAHEALCSSPSLISRHLHNADMEDMHVYIRASPGTATVSVSAIPRSRDRAPLRLAVPKTSRKRSDVSVVVARASPTGKSDEPTQAASPSVPAPAPAPVAPKVLAPVVPPVPAPVCIDDPCSFLPWLHEKKPLAAGAIASSFAYFQTRMTALTQGEASVRGVGDGRRLDTSTREESLLRSLVLSKNGAYALWYVTSTPSSSVLAIVEATLSQNAESTFGFIGRDRTFSASHEALIAAGFTWRSATTDRRCFSLEVGIMGGKSCSCAVCTSACGSGLLVPLYMLHFVRA